MSAYEAFLDGKQFRVPPVGVEPGPVHPSLYDFQAAIVRWAVRRGRAAIFSDCGTGKTRMQLEWLRQYEGARLIVAPLCVAEQTIEEAAALGLELRYTTEQPNDPAGVWITNYERLHGFDPDVWQALVLDESSILKSTDGKTRTRLLSDFTRVPYRLCCTATPAPNDVTELANHAEFMGVMSRPEFLASWFVHDSDTSGRDGWRLKGHAVEPFWRWVATWALFLRRPSDLGFADGGFELPPLRFHEVRVESNWRPEGMLFAIGTPGGVQGRHAARRETLEPRVRAAVELVRSQPGSWLVWCGLNAEQTALERALGGATVSIQGSTPESARIVREGAWRNGEADVLIAKPVQFGHGMNWQHCHRMVFVGIGDSYEQYYQAIRRCWRFGQTHPVEVYIVTSDAETAIVENVKRKEAEALELSRQIIEKVREAGMQAVHGQTRDIAAYRPTVPIQLPGFMK